MLPARSSSSSANENPGRPVLVELDGLGVESDALGGADAGIRIDDQAYGHDVPPSDGRW